MIAKVTSVLAFLCLVSLGSTRYKNGDYTPIVMWHGMGDSCCFPFSLGAIAKKLNESMPGVFIHSLKMGDSIVGDVESGYFMHPDKQIVKACEKIKSIPELADGFNAIGFSQGGQFLRALVQRCDGPQMKNLISIGGQHQGVYGLPHCGSLSHPTCDYIRKLLNHAAYLKWVQDILVQATYWHDPLDLQAYIEGSTFLADINNERGINDSYVERLKQLENFVMVKFQNDTMVQPVESEWFGFYSPGQAVNTQILQESTLYTENRLGLLEMDQNGQLAFLEVEGDHLQFDWGWFEDHIIDPYLSR